jgi:N-acetyl-anhydromuramoyl-L-alanine amidase
VSRESKNRLRHSRPTACKSARSRLTVDPRGLVKHAKYLASPNCDERPAGCALDLIVVHHISVPPGKFGGPGIAELFTNRLDPSAHPAYAPIARLRVSSHFLIRRDGGLIQFVPCSKRAWHAGESAWRGRARCNDFSIGIELEGTGEIAYTDAQYERLAALTRALQLRYRIADIAGHSDIAPGRKQDPGPSFDWKRYRALLRKAHTWMTKRTQRSVKKRPLRMRVRRKKRGTRARSPVGC